MEEKQITGGHKIWISGRKSGTVTGISDVLSFDETEILMDTEMGMLSIKGKGLHISKLNLEKGEADLEGQVDSLTYSASGHKKEKEAGLLQRLMS
ncbi:sporulation protein YabP [Lachnospiraceae bacterium OF09-6]|nr:sporulation protein YabP [Lachnospiraceae bacterium OF09-6]